MPLALEKPSHSPTRVTAGYPSLDGGREYQITEAALQGVYQKALQTEYCQNDANAVADDNGMDVTNAEQMVGIPLVGARIVSRLRRLNGNLWFEHSNADRSKMGCYILVPAFGGGMDKKFIAGFETELNPEFTIRVVDSEGKPKAIISGWRRLLMRLIQKQFITEARAWAVFGPPSHDSENWARFTT